MAGNGRLRGGTSKFERELRRLECSVKFKGSSSGGQGKEGPVFDSSGK